MWRYKWLLQLTSQFERVKKKMTQCGIFINVKYNHNASGNKN
jgi:hypothetical protein